MNDSTLIHFISLNTQGLRDTEKRQRLLHWLNQQKAKIVYLQETHFTKDIELKIKSQFFDWQCYHSFGNSNSCGVSVFFHKSLNVNVSNTHTDKNGRFLLLNITIENNEITIINIYAHNTEKSRNDFFDSYLPLIKKENKNLFILGGDFNEVLTKADRKPSPVNLKNSNALLKLIKELNLNDIWRTKNASKSQFTWKRKNGIEKSRIDYWLINEDIIPLVHSCDIRPAIIKYTDHMAISIKLFLNNKRGPGTWKFNNSLLEDKTYISKFNTFINECINKYQTSEDNPQIIWELLKIDIKEFTITYSKQKRKNQNYYLTILEKELALLIEKKDSNIILNQQCNDRMIFIEKEIENIYSKKAKGAMIRSRIQIIDEGEKCTNYFINLEKSRQSRKVIHTLNIDGNITTERNKILEAESDFYKTLYTATQTDDRDIDNYLTDIDIPVLDRDSSVLCDGHLTEIECLNSLKEMKLNKSPGSDGLTVEFYQTFWKNLGPIIVKSLNHAYDNKKLSHSQKHSILSLIYKKVTPMILKIGGPFLF